eukprot:48947_1
MSTTLTKDDQPMLQEEHNRLAGDINNLLEEKKGIEDEITRLKNQQGNPGAMKGIELETTIEKKNERIATMEKEIQAKRTRKEELDRKLKKVEKMTNTAHREVWNEYDDVSGQNAYIPLHINHGYNDYNQYHAVNALGGSYNEHSSVEYLLLSAVFLVLIGVCCCVVIAVSFVTGYATKSFRLGRKGKDEYEEISNV